MIRGSRPTMPSSNVVKLQPRNHNQQDLKVFTARFRDAIKRSIQGILDAGAVLIDAKEQLEYGTFQNWVLNDLKIGLRQAQMLMQICKHPTISNLRTTGSLPPSWRTLYELAQLRPQKFTEYIESGKINPMMVREEAISLRLSSYSSGGSQPKPKIPKLHPELAILVEASMALSGADVVMKYITNLSEASEPTLKEFDRAVVWSRKKLSASRKPI
jgi:hypothetical protein